MGLSQILIQEYLNELRDLERLQAREAGAGSRHGNREPAGLDSHARDQKAMQERYKGARQELADRQAANREATERS